MSDQVDIDIPRLEAKASPADLLDMVDSGLAMAEGRLRRSGGSSDPAASANVLTLLRSLEPVLEEVRSRLDAGELPPSPARRFSDTRLETQRERFWGLMAEVARAPRPDAAAPRPDASAPAVTEVPHRIRRAEAVAVAGHALTIFGVVMLGLAVYLFGLSANSHDRSQSRLFRHFAQPLAFGTAPLGGRIERGAPVAVLTIHRLGLREVVVEGTDSSQLKRGPGHLPTTPLPGQAGNVVIAARRMTYGGPFRSLGSMRVGDEINLTTGQGTEKYLVEAKRVVRAGQADVIAQTAENRLTLITSNPALLKLPPPVDPATGRLVVVAKLASPVLPAPPGRPHQRASLDQGLTGGGVPFTVSVWLALLLMAAVATALLYRRASRWTTYLITTPVLLALAMLVFDSIGRLLPATL